MAATAAAAAAPGADFHYGNAAGGGAGYNGAVCVCIMIDFSWIVKKRFHLGRHQSLIIY